MKKPYLIGEIASSWNSDLELAKAMIRVLKDCGWNAAKFQSWKAEYVKDGDPDKKRYEKYQLHDEQHWELKEYCEKIGIDFFTTVTRIERIPFLKELGLTKVKIASISLSNFELLKAAADNFETVFASTATQTDEVIEKAHQILSKTNYVLFHCRALYPCPLEECNLNKIDWMKSKGYNTGFSDHSYGFEAPVIAMSKGVLAIEKHFTLSKYLPQTPHQMYAGGPYVTTHEVANEPEVFKQINEWRNIIERATGESSVDSKRIEGAIKSRYENRY